MKAFDLLSALVVPIDRANIDTDALIPKQFMKSIQRSGFGVSGMEERVAMLGGRFSIASEPGRGVRLTACLPLVGRAA